ncbi:hypothetical protein [Wenjunlia tyrosinilytica]|uniref:Uncharacterized protein n=1 Tax=Wenjunlia tyrosinilytica TaxID=1544741 RepID=A0A918DZJ6_9ACTN|nr:hypothetical protein [Wenjunlia tyrosinilytica]GGO94140.1 hypothetical protein GCM10012280_48290 [Wenjunlia tyrosinilytica]
MHGSVRGARADRAMCCVAAAGLAVALSGGIGTVHAVQQAGVEHNAGVRRADPTVSCENVTGLIEAIDNANKGASGPITLAEGCTYDINDKPLPRITGTVGIEGHGSQLLRELKKDRSRILEVAEGARLTLTDVTLTGGQAESGGALYIDGGEVVLNGTSRLANAAASASGAEVFNKRGTLTLNDTALVEHGVTPLGKGGGVYNDGGTVTVNDRARIAGNRGLRGGGGIYNSKGTVTLNDDARIEDNDGGRGNGGGIYNDGGTVDYRTTHAITGNRPDDCRDCSPAAGTGNSGTDSSGTDSSGTDSSGTDSSGTDSSGTGGSGPENSGPDPT